MSPDAERPAGELGKADRADVMGLDLVPKID